MSPLLPQKLPALQCFLFCFESCSKFQALEWEGKKKSYCKKRENTSSIRNTGLPSFTQFPILLERLAKIQSRSLETEPAYTEDQQLEAHEGARDANLVASPGGPGLPQA